MCFHSKQSKTAQQIENRFKAKFKPNSLFQSTEHYNGFDFPKTPIISANNTTEIEMANWGLFPNWADENWNKTYTLNARVESLKEKPAFKNNLENRCIILVDGFYEWQHIHQQKIKYEIGFKHKLFAFAGLYSVHKNVKTYSIITTQAKGVMEEIHNTKKRMPVALYSDYEIERWLQNNQIIENYNFTATPLDSIQTALF